MKNIRNWLLEETDPSVRYVALRDLLGRPNDDSELRVAQAAISSSKVVKRIFSTQKPAGHWEDASSPYLPKYKSSYWQIMILGQLGLDNRDERVKKACEYIFKFQLAEGGFATQTKQASRREYDWLLRKKKKLPPFTE